MPDATLTDVSLLHGLVTADEISVVADGRRRPRVGRRRHRRQRRPRLAVNGTPVDPAVQPDRDPRRGHAHGPADGGHDDRPHQGREITGLPAAAEPSQDGLAGGGRLIVGPAPGAGARHSLRACSRRRRRLPIRSRCRRRRRSRHLRPSPATPASRAAAGVGLDALIRHLPTGVARASKGLGAGGRPDGLPPSPPWRPPRRRPPRYWRASPAPCFRSTAATPLSTTGTRSQGYVHQGIDIAAAAGTPVVRSWTAASRAWITAHRPARTFLTTAAGDRFLYCHFSASPRPAFGPGRDGRRRDRATWAATGDATDAPALRDPPHGGAPINPYPYLQRGGPAPDLRELGPAARPPAPWPGRRALAHAAAGPRSKSKAT